MLPRQARVGTLLSLYKFYISMTVCYVWAAHLALEYICMSVYVYVCVRVRVNSVMSIYGIYMYICTGFSKITEEV